MWQPVTMGRSGAVVLRGDGVYRKHTAAAGTEATTLTWLRSQGLPAAEVLDVGPDWLLTREIIGQTAAHPWPRHRRRAVVDALAEVTRAVHAVAVDSCPFDSTLAVTVPEARDATQTGSVDLDDLDAERRGQSAQELVDLLVARLPSMQAREEPVVTHGDWCLPNVLLDPDTVEVVGLIDTARVGRADAYTDFALMSRSLSSEERNPQYGPEYAERFLRRCGQDPTDPAALDFYRLLDEFF